VCFDGRNKVTSDPRLICGDRLEGQMCDLIVQGCPFSEQCLELFATIARSFALWRTGGALIKHVKVGAQVDYQATRTKRLAILLAQHRAAAGSQKHTVNLCQLFNQRRLAGPETCLAFDFEYGRNLDAITLSQFGINIDELKIERLSSETRRSA
jgi:hypothetical protein